MGTHAMAYVKFGLLRQGPGNHPAFRANFYRSNDSNIKKLYDGGTLWVVTGLTYRSSMVQIHYRLPVITRG